MKVTIDLAWVLYVLAAYIAVGLVLTPALLAWANSGISPKRPWHDGLGGPRPWFVSAVAWPGLIYYAWATPRHNRKVLEKWREINRRDEYNHYDL